MKSYFWLLKTGVSVFHPVRVICFGVVQLMWWRSALLSAALSGMHCTQWPALHPSLWRTALITNALHSSFWRSALITLTHGTHHPNALHSSPWRTALITRTHCTHHPDALHSSSAETHACMHWRAIKHPHPLFSQILKALGRHATQKCFMFIQAEWKVCVRRKVCLWVSLTPLGVSGQTIEGPLTKRV